ncbi:unnamed protein product [Calicophoron daubneyi]
MSQATAPSKEEHGSNPPSKETTHNPHVEDVQSMECRLLKLLDEFNSGSMMSFGPNCPYEKLDAVRDQQEELMRLHFEQDRKMQNMIDAGSGRGRRPVRS